MTVMQANAVSDKILDLRNCNFNGKNLSGKVLSGALLSNATLQNAILRETVLTKVCSSVHRPFQLLWRGDKGLLDDLSALPHEL